MYFGTGGVYLCKSSVTYPQETEVYRIQTVLGQRMVILTTYGMTHSHLI